MTQKYNKIPASLIAKAVFLLLLLVFTITMVIAPPIVKVCNEETWIVTVTDKDRVSDKNKYLVYTFDQQGESRVFEITDSLLKFRFDSSDDYNRIEVGKTYRITTCGYRVPILSWYPNIYEFSEYNIVVVEE